MRETGHFARETAAVLPGGRRRDQRLHRRFREIEFVSGGQLAVHIKAQRRAVEGGREVLPLVEHDRGGARRRRNPVGTLRVVHLQTFPVADPHKPTAGIGGEITLGADEIDAVAKARHERRVCHRAGGPHPGGNRPGLRGTDRRRAVEPLDHAGTAAVRLDVDRPENCRATRSHRGGFTSEGTDNSQQAKGEATLHRNRQ